MLVNFLRPKQDRYQGMNKRGLQIVMVLLGAIPVLTGIIGMFGLSDPLYASAGIPANAVLDSNLRFLAACG
jgi:hypothetical protein